VDQLLVPDEKLQNCDLPRRVGERLVDSVRRHANGHPQNDDIAVVCFGRLEAGRGPSTGLNRAVEVKDLP
jgi:hypothetical protein